MRGRGDTSDETVNRITLEGSVSCHHRAAGAKE
jgi:hypothetical protein